MRFAAVTMVWNQPEYLSLWARYYGRQLGPENLFVVDHGSEPRAALSLPEGANTVRIPRGLRDEIQRSRFISDFVRALLHYHDGAVFADVDEMVVPDPARHEGLAAFLRDAVTEEAPVAPLGIEVMQAPGEEAPIDWSRPILGQRRHGRFYASMCKPVLVRRAVDWNPGLHDARQPARYAGDLFLFHLKAIDPALSLGRLAVTRGLAYAPSNLAQDLSKLHRRTDEEHLEQYYREPARELAEKGPAPWEFGPELAGLREGRPPPGYRIRPGGIYGPPLRIPDRFLGLV